MGVVDAFVIIFTRRTTWIKYADESHEAEGSKWLTVIDARLMDAVGAVPELVRPVLIVSWTTQVCVCSQPC